MLTYHADAVQHTVILLPGAAAQFTEFGRQITQYDMEVSLHNRL
jgi:hypothetical protein